MIIHSLFILRRSGVPAYHKDFSGEMQKVDPNLLSSFFTAILDFSKAVMNKYIDVLDMGELRFFFWTGESEITFILVTDTSYSVILVRERLKLISEAFKFHCGPEILAGDACLEDSKFDAEIDGIINLKEDFSADITQPIQRLFEWQVAKEDVLGGALLSMTGKIFYSSLPPEFLHSSLKELEIRFKTDTSQFKKHEMPKLILQVGNRLIFSQAIMSEKFQMPVLCVLLFDASTNLGMADFALETALKELQPLL